MKQLSRERLEALASGNAFTCIQDDEATLMAQMLLEGMAQEQIHQLFAPGPSESSWIDVEDEEEMTRLRRLGATIRTLYAAPPVPVVPDGCVMVPIEPTEDMVIEGFESAPDRFFSKPWEWEAYEAMSGCQQAAHRAKLCWAAMLAAAPKAP